MAEVKRTIEEIDADIEATRAALADVHGSETEVYARIVGYYRAVRNWNKGKREEYDHRKCGVRNYRSGQRMRVRLPRTSYAACGKSFRFSHGGF